MDASLLEGKPPGAVFIPTRMVAPLWRLAEPWVQKALDTMDGQYTVGDIRDALLAGKMQLFFAWADGVKGAVITEIINYPQMRVLRGFLIGGEEFAKWMPAMHEKLLRYCEYQQCAHFETVVRPGLAELLKPYGWKASQVMLVHKGVNDGQR